MAEVLKVDEVLSSMILNQDSHKKIRKYLKKIAFKTMFDDGKEKVSKGITTLEQVYKMVDI